MRPSAGPAVALLLLLVSTLLGGCAAAPNPAPTSAAASSTPSAVAPAPDPAAARRAALESRVTRALAGLDRAGRIAQLFVVGVPLDGLTAADPLLRDRRVGGVFLRGRSELPAAALATTTARWRSLAPGPTPWVAVDQEGGAVRTLRGPGFPSLPPAREQGQLPPDQLGEVADGLGAALAAAGITLDLAPVADIVPAGTERGNAPIGAFGREYGGTAPTVTTAARTVIDGLASNGVRATLKHFPGLGRVRENTDTAPDVTDTATGPGDAQIAAFGELARSPARPFVMTSSATYRLIDPANPAAFSPAVITGLLRDRLGFDGPVISDDLGSARAVQNLPPGERAVRFLAAGGTLVLTVDATVVPEMLAAVRDRAAADPAFAAAVDRAVRTALLAKAESGLLPG